MATPTCSRQTPTACRSSRATNAAPAPSCSARAARALGAIHRIALQSGREVAAVKPRACRHWPLILEPVGRGLRITVHPDAQTLGGVARLADLPGQPSMREAFASE